VISGLSTIGTSIDKGFQGTVSCSLSLDAVEELIQDREYDFRFGKMTTGLPDLERVISRIHAGDCKTRDFLRVIEARYPLA